jgi:uncharacterized protein YuzE
MTYDALADAVYLKISEQSIANTVRADTNRIIDRDAAGRVVGRELLNASRERDFLQDLQEHATYGLPIEIVSATPTIAA